MQLIHYFESPEGVFSVWCINDRYALEFEGDTFGSYNELRDLLAALAEDRILALPRKIKTSKLGFPDDISAWEAA